MLTKAKLLRMPAKKYMAKEQLEFFTAQLTEQKAEALSEIESARQRLRVPQSVKMRLTGPLLKLIPSCT